MLFSSFCAALVAPAVAFPYAVETRADDPRFTAWQAPGSDDVRSPCPGLNTLANHGFIHRNGKDLTVAHLMEGMKAGLNVGADFAQAIGNLGLLSAPNFLKGTFDLNHLDQHNFPVEHDASLSRQDTFFGDNSRFHQPNWNMILQAYTGKTLTDIPTAAKAKYTRLQDSKKRNPGLTYGPVQFVLSYGETALYLQTMGDTTSGKTRIDYIRSLFEKEQLPYNLGWRPSKNEVNLFTLGNQVLQLYSSSPEPGPEGFLVTANTYKDVLVALAAGRQIISNLTGSAIPSSS